MGVEASNDTIRDYFRFFVNRRAYTVQATRPCPETGRHYYYRPMEKGTGHALTSPSQFRTFVRES